MKRKPMMAGNWKMNKTISEAKELALALKASAGAETKVDVVLCPPFLAIPTVAEAVAGSNIKVAAQDFFWKEKGAYTGEISAQMIKDGGCASVVIGHSERRGRFGKVEDDLVGEGLGPFGDNNTTVNTKTKAALDAGLLPIVCCGETLAERKTGKTDLVVKSQVLAALAGLSGEEIAKVVIAYEPVWAIGTGEVCDSAEANRVLGMIRGALAELVGDTAQAMQILYGGSVAPDNIEELMAQPEIDGGLVGGASLVAEKFQALIDAAAKARGGCCGCGG